MAYCTGIGSRSTPIAVQDDIKGIAHKLALNGFVLRSGGASGADQAFEQGAGTYAKEIYLPWKRFQNNPSTLYMPSKQAYEIAEHFHPNWKACSQAARKLHARNSHQVLGKNLDTQSMFVVCWTPQKHEGGTGQALRIARYYGIPIFNFNRYCRRQIENEIRVLTSVTSLDDGIR